MKRTKVRASPFSLDHRLTLAVLVIALGIWYLPFLIQGKLFYSADHYPGFFSKKIYWAESFQRFGSFQFWNPYVNLGTSDIFNPVSGVFYPPHVFAWLFSTEFFFRYAGLAHLIFLAWGLIRWQRALVGKEAGYWIPILFVTAPLVGTFTVTNYTHLNSMTWTVWILSELAQDPLTRWGRARLLAFWSVLITNGEPFSLLLVGGITAYHFLRKREYGFVFLSGLVSLAVVALVFGPSLLILKYSTRSGGLDDAERLAFSFHPLRIVTFFSPYFFGHQRLGPFDTSQLVNDSPYYPRFYFDTPFLSLPVIVFLVLGVRRAIREREGFLLIPFVIGLLLSFGKWGPLLYLQFPPFSLIRHPEKMIPVTSLFMAGLAMKGFSEAKENRWWCLAVILIGMLVPLFAGGRELVYAALAVAFGLGFFTEISREKTGLAFGVFALIIGLSQNFIGQPPEVTIPRETRFQRGPAAEAVMNSLKEGSLERFEAYRDPPLTEKPHEALVYGANQVYRRASMLGYDAVETKFVGEVHARLYLGEDAPEEEAKRAVIPRDQFEAITQLANIRLILIRKDKRLPAMYAALDEQSPLFRPEEVDKNWVALRPLKAPHAMWWFPRLDRGLTRRDVSSFIFPPEVNPDRIYLRGTELPRGVLASGRYIHECEKNLSPMGLPEKALTKITEDHLRFEVEAPCDGWIFLSQNLLPGWRLRAASGEIPLFPLNGNFVGFSVKKGHFQGDFVFEPWQTLARLILPTGHLAAF